jgi:hypothetical protein
MKRCSNDAAYQGHLSADGEVSSMSDNALTPDRLHTLLVTFKSRQGEKYSLRTLGYFGFFARGAATPESNVDILFDTDAPNLFMTSPGSDHAIILYSNGIFPIILILKP